MIRKICITTGFLWLTLLLVCCEENNKLPDPLEAGWNGQKVCEVLEENEHLRTLKCTFPPGVGHERHFHNTHFGYTIKGGTFRITDTTGTREVNIPTGYSFYNEQVEWHEVLNIGDSTAIFLIVEPK
ncbi:MAG: cupin domain-containing protein [Psychroserpens sp.]|nr:cupin domain-containing protein [Psychroserpens sp.]